MTKSPICLSIFLVLAAVMAGGQAGATDGAVSWGAWSDPIQESGKNSGGVSEYTCPDGQVMVGRRHAGDENGNTWYLCATVSYAGIAAKVGQGEWSSWIQESGKDSGGTSSYQCPINSVMIGRRHKGDENGDTSYECGPLSLSAHGLAFTPQSWSAWIQESGKNSGGESDYTCPANQLMIGRNTPAMKTETRPISARPFSGARLRSERALPFRVIRSKNPVRIVAVLPVSPA